MGIAGLAENVAVRGERPDFPLRDQVPKGLQLAQAVLGRIAGNDGRIDRADGNAGHPVRLNAGFVHGLIDTGLIGAQRTAALQNKRNAVATFRPPTDSRGGRTRWMIGQAGADIVHGDTRIGMGVRGTSPLPKRVTAK